MRAALVLLATAAASLCCEDNGVLFKDGQTWISGPFLKKCKQRTYTVSIGWQIEILACFTQDGAQIPTGESRTIGNTIYTCDKRQGGQVSLTSRSVSIAPSFSLNDITGNGKYVVPPLQGN
ncbi:hypothetical protein Y032_0447g1627 [Ancylostoma ceylanicum]|uniref:Abnormal cell migration protein 18-like fibronectin type I domain-containing protein n=1 Tax=Ancylostoma ceylanicum TaxID=53326 RepID=A0A016WYF4_9BILA|nr:hypothetical protein Y032_0447g1627 [Ancylostoma ceylanicum]